MRSFAGQMILYSRVNQSSLFWVRNPGISNFRRLRLPWPQLKAVLKSDWMKGKFLFSSGRSGSIGRKRPRVTESKLLQPFWLDLWTEPTDANLNSVGLRFSRLRNVRCMDSGSSAELMLSEAMNSLWSETERVSTVKACEQKKWCLDQMLREYYFWPW